MMGKIALRCHSLLFIWISIFNSCFGVSNNAKAKVISASLDAKWLSTPLVLEVSEYLAEENPQLFWDYVDRICDLDPTYLNFGSDRDYYDLIIKEASHLISSEKLRLLKFTLALRCYSPAVETFRQIAAIRNLPSECSSVIEVNSKFTCDPLELEELLSDAHTRNQSEVYKMDHRFPKSLTDLPITVFLYGELGSASFREFHFILKELAKSGRFNYIIRHYIKDDSNLHKVRLSGFGVELAIKNTEYKAQDDTKVKADDVKEEEASEKVDVVEELDGFAFTRLKTIYPDLAGALDKFRDQLLEENNDLAPLKVWQLKDLGMQVAQRIMTAPADEALKVMRSISQNFPLLARSLTKTTLNEKLRLEIAKNQAIFTQHFSISQSDTAFFINGIFFDPDVSDIFAILEAIREEQNLIESLHNLGVPNDQMEKIIALDLGKARQDYAVDIRDSAIKYLNDLESDRAYASWLPSINDILRPTYPGMLRSIRKNIFHLVAIVDPSQKESRDLLKLLESFYVHNAPIRIGLMLAVNFDPAIDGLNDAGVAMLNAFNFIAEERGKLYKGLSFITDIYAKLKGDVNPTSKDVVKAFKIEFPQEDIELIFGTDSDYDTGRTLAREFLLRTGIKDIPTVLINGVRLPSEKLNADDFEEAVLLEIMEQTAIVQKAVYKGQLNDNQDVLEFLMQRENVVPRLNARVLNATMNLLTIGGKPALKPTAESFKELSTPDKTSSIIAEIPYLTDKESLSFCPITVWVVADISNARGQQLVLDAIDQIKNSNELRIAIIHNSIKLDDANFVKIVDVLDFVLNQLNHRRSRFLTEQMLSSKRMKAYLSGESSPLELLKDDEKELYETWEKDSRKDTLKKHSIYCKEVLQFQQDEKGLVVNGQILGPFSEDEVFTVEDFSLLERYSLTMFGNKIREVFENMMSEGEYDSVSDLAFRVTALILSRQSTRVRHQLKYHSSDHSVVKIPEQDPNSPAFNITVIVDPVSKGAQKITHILAVLQEVLNCKIWIFLSPQDKLSDMPLKTFYRYVLDSEIQFTSDDKFSAGPVARFQKLPTSALLTMHMDTPENWLVEVVRTPYDLDNIHLEKLDGSVYGEFELEHLLIEGHCFDQASGSPPRGLQFVLGTPKQPELVDTIVMANLGYFQLKASAGAWILKLRQGRSYEIYDIASHENTDSPSESDNVQILVGSLRSKIVKIKVSKKPDKKKMDLLSDDESDSGTGLWNSIASTFGSKNPDDASNDDVINIFSLASGHLYERLSRIMMLSVLKHTETPVKFWFLKNYLSPTFKDFLPIMAVRYGFQYELVQYKWPRWLHQQTEKQRVIWGYKILFLDVLFPLSVKKIIFVDADLVVRANLKELRDLDLGGAPYGYTPFCDGRKEMDGYRFWKSGYWASHLQGRKYHISALYVVDLKKFRRIAAGDRLRGQYQGLSQDPNSLSNLDQDLPNNMIHQVAIKSLPQDWLWCETWCEATSLSRAKAIDLCNNPQTKESKLSSAMRIIPEWKGYDDEIRLLMEETAAGKESNKSGIIDDLKKDDKHEHADL